jgi:predicted aldo/keto reductase-like oxidoreductase
MNMEYRRLGRTGLDVSVIGLGTEYLNKQPRETVVAVVREAIERGVNYFDLVFSFPEYLVNLAVAFEGCRDHILLTGHLGSTEKDGQYHKTRSVKKGETFFLDLLSRLGTDYVDVLFLHNFNTMKDYDRVMQPDGQMDLARRLQREGKARFVGISAHSIEVAIKAIESGQIDVLMLPVNLAANAVAGKRDVLLACAANDVGLVAMKPFAGGKLLSSERTVRVAGYQMGGAALKLKKATPITPVQCLSYSLAQVGVCATVPGCKDVEQLSAALAYVDAADEERDFSALLAEFQQYAEGECVYCNHCLPCPAVIDIGQIIRMMETAQQQMAVDLQNAYGALSARASDCTACGACVERCPFGVDVVAKMARAVELFEEAAA